MVGVGLAGGLSQSVCSGLRSVKISITLDLHMLYKLDSRVLLSHLPVIPRQRFTLVALELRGSASLNGLQACALSDSRFMTAANPFPAFL